MAEMVPNVPRIERDKSTPLMKQYYEIKARYPDTILMFRMGDFFEAFDDDAAIVAKICGIALTKRNNGNAAASPLAGFPHHQLDNYLPKLVKAGCRVAVCEQIEDPKKKTGSIVRRDVIEVVTPGISLYDKLLDSSRNNYICSVYLAFKTDLHFKENAKSVFAEDGPPAVGIALCDISTGEFLAGEIMFSQLLQVIEQYSPAEILYSKDQKNVIEGILSQTPHKVSLTKIEEWIFEPSFARELLLRQFQTLSFKGFGMESLQVGLSAAGVVLHYISETQKQMLPQIHSMRLLDVSEYMLLDYATRRNLEILHTMEGEAHGSLIKILDKTLTPPGARLLKKWLNQPLNTLDRIYNRLNCVEFLVNNNDVLAKLTTLLTNFGDMERLLGRLASGKVTPKEVVTLAYSLNKIPNIISLLKQESKPQTDKDNFKAIELITKKLIPLDELVQVVKTAMLEEPSLQFGEGNIFRPKYNAELDSYTQAKYSAKEWLQQYQANERQNAGIPSLKVSYNGVFGYYIEITKTHASKAPMHYERKQTLANAERYTTPELKEFEAKILTAEANIFELEHLLWSKIKEQILHFVSAIQQNAYYISVLDCLQSFAAASISNNYTKPLIDSSNVLEIDSGRHPVVEKLLPLGQSFVANSTFMGGESELVHIITGPNMAGKSCYLRQVALIVLMGQVGCFVPAARARFGLVDRIFTRVGAQDNIAGGESTFLVEMQEAALILHNATARSLILLDEVGRGTATTDGISIAQAIAEHIHNCISARTLFATHYHELTALAQHYSQIANYKADVVTDTMFDGEQKIIFTHKFSAGTSDNSFGIYVGRLAGLPHEVVARASDVMREFDGRAQAPSSKLKGGVLKKAKPDADYNQLSIFEIQDDKIRTKLREININNLTPLGALEALKAMQDML